MATLNITLTVPDNKAQELLDDFANWHEYDQSQHGTKQNFVKVKVLEMIRNSIMAQKKKEGRAIADAEAIAAAEEITIS